METVLLTVGILAAFIAVFAWIAFLDTKRAAKRTQDFGAVAKELGFDFFPEGDPALLARMQSFGLAAPGRIPRLINLLRGTANNVTAAIFEYDYRTGTDPEAIGVAQTVIVFLSPDLRLPAFAMGPEYFWHKIGSLLGMQDIDFASHPTFSSRYLLRANDEAALRARFTPKVLDHFQETANLTVEGVDDTLLFYREGKRVDAKNLQAFLSEGFAALGVLRSPN